MKLPFACSLALLVACGGDDGATPIDAPRPDAAIDAPSACGELPPGSFTGTVGGTTIAPVVRSIVIDGQLWEVGVLEAGGCGQGTGGAQGLDIQFCAPPTLGVHTVVAHADHDCPGDDAAVYYIDDVAVDIYDAVSGTVTITAVGPCSSGSFDITFPDGDRVTGDFNATVCD